ncbi:MAG: rhomboid family intramembrane serine protease [Weeksellaceae bacterium]
MLGMSMVTLIIIGITVIVSMKGFSDFIFFDRYKFQPGPILHYKQFDRLLTSGFLHVNTTHLLFNMLTLYFFADVVIQFFTIQTGNTQFGNVLFALVYVLAILGGNLLALFFQKNNLNYSAVGASGGVSGILFASVLAYPDLTLYLFFAIPIKGWLFAILFLGYSVYGVRNQVGNIGHEAHLGGAIVGLIAPLIINPGLFQQNQIYIYGMLVPIVILFVMAMRTKK